MRNIQKVPDPTNTETIPCPNCGGKGAAFLRGDDGHIYDYIICKRCQGVGTIVITIKKDYPED